MYIYLHLKTNEQTCFMGLKIHLSVREQRCNSFGEQQESSKLYTFTIDVATFEL